uniref:DUF364 domain-containing protein n=1 Tax=Castellaniella defragrans TaxID=75697 RepID=UPI00334256A2
MPSALKNPQATPGTPAAQLLAALHAEVVDKLGAGIESLSIERAVLGIFFTGVKLSNGAGGLCATPIKSVPEAVCCPSSAHAMPAPGKIKGRPVSKMLEDLYRPQDLRRTLAIATLNALVETLWQRDGAPANVEVSDGDAFDALVIRPDDYVVMVGAFVPYMRELRRRNQRFSVLELDPDTFKPDELPFYVEAHRAPEIVPEADVFITTGTTLINDTLDDLLALLKPGAEAAVIGPTAALIPGPFAGRGATVVGGTRVLEPDALLDMLAEGGSGYHLFGKTVARVSLRLRHQQGKDSR